MSRYEHLKEETCAANKKLPALGLVILNFGNLSIRDPDLGVFAIKPSGIPYDELVPEKIVIVDFDGKTVEGNLKPSSDTLTHAVLYKSWEKIGSIVHTHSIYATAWAQAQRAIPVYGTTHADFISGPVPCAPPMTDDMIKGNYEYQTGHQIIDHLRFLNLSYEEVEMILVGSHGPFTWGKNAAKALYNSAILESIAHMALLTEQINPKTALLKRALMKKHFERKHGPDAYYGQ